MTEVTLLPGQPIIGEPIKASRQIPYVIIRLIRLDDEWTTGCVYGPYDLHGAAKAYTTLVKAGLSDGPNCKLQVRGLVPTGDARSVQV